MSHPEAIKVACRRGIHEATVPGDSQEARVCWRKEKSGFFLKFKVSGTWYYQWLMFSCRAGKTSYYPAMIALYKSLVRQGIVKRGSLRAMAS